MLCFYNFYFNMIVNNIIASVPTVVTLSDNANITEVVDIIKAFVDVLIYFSTSVRIKICKKRNCKKFNLKYYNEYYHKT